VRTGAKATRVSRNGAVAVELEGGDRVEAEEVLVAVGRRARVQSIGLESAGIEPDKYLEVDDELRVDGREWLYAVGDVNGRALLTHMGKYQARIAADRILGKNAAATSEAIGPPRVTFTDPQVAAVGLTEEQAREKGIDLRVVSYDVGAVAGAYTRGNDIRGTSQIVVDEARRVIVGATFTGPDVQELVHAATIAVVGEVPLERLWHAVPSFPTVSEVWLRLLETYGM
jgi:pyruvate/2-oxoglutarate dehydrogenase complex dihydrolipoamide dehydrogenase (E3) component